jgi:hypothetical protein
MRAERLWLAALLALVCASAPTAGRAEEEAEDPTRGHWDGFLDPVRDAEDYLTDARDRFEKRTDIHLGAGITKSWMYNFNDPDSDLHTLHSLDPDHASAELDFAQVRASRPSEDFLPGFGLTLGAGRAAKRFKADWDGDGALATGDTFEKNSFEVQEAYLAWTVPDSAPLLSGLTLKGGKFVTLLGAEVIEPWANYNFSRSYLFGLAIPFTHTGGLVSYAIGDNLSLTGGVVTGWDNVDDSNNGASYLGNVTYLPSDKITLSASGIYGAEQAGREGPKRGVADFVAIFRPVSPLTFVLNYDWGHEADAEGGTRPALWQGFAAIVNYDFTERCSGAVRAEWFEDEGATRTGLRQTLWETTVTAKYLITQHLAWRLEYRHDESTRDGVFEAGGGRFLSGQDILGFEFTYLFS